MAKAGNGEGGKSRPGRDSRGTLVTDVVGEDGNRIVRIGHYHDADLSKPVGFGQFMAFLPTFVRGVEKGKWSGLVFDSTSFANLLARKWSEYDLNKSTKNPLQHFGFSTDMIEEMLCIQLPALNCHVVTIMHESIQVVSDGEGGSVRTPFLPGKRLIQTQMVSAAWPEQYRLYPARNDKGEKVRLLQTETDELWGAGTVLGIPTDSLARWKTIAKYLPEGQVWHAILYGQPYIGKSTLAAELAGAMAKAGKPPIYVASFDGQGKDVPYRRLGRVVVPEAA